MNILKEIWRKRHFYLLLLLPLILYSLFIFYPIIDVIRLSLLEHPYWPDQRFVGVDNYIKIFTADPRFYNAFINNIIILVLSMIGNAGTGLLLAVALYSVKNTLLKKIYLITFLWPYMMSSVAVGKLFQRLYDPYFGLLNVTFRSLGLESLTRVWLADPNIAMFSVWLACWWMSYPINMLIFYAGLQGIDRRLYESARIDGAGRLSIFRHITIPCLRPIILVVFTLITIGAFKVFDIVWVLGGGAPLQPFLDVLATLQFNLAWYFNYFGYGAALAIIMTVIIMVPTIVYLRMQEV